MRKNIDLSTVEFMRPREVATLLGASASGIYGRCERGEIPSKRIGRSIVIPGAWVREQLGDALPAVASPDPSRSPRLPADMAPRESFTLKMRASLRDRLQASADENGRTLGNEVERRLLASYEGSDLEAIVQRQVRAALKDALYAFTMWQQGHGPSPLEDEDEPSQRPQ